jgi:uncharacterized protein (DUF1501 family)
VLFRSNPLKAAYARNCLLSRRLLEKGVRYVSLYCASRASAVDGLLNWDAHKTLKADYDRHAPVFDQPTAALLADLKQRGLLQDTLVIWCTEFGRMPTHQEGTTGRDHNPDAFTTWMMGAGVRGTIALTFGATKGNTRIINCTSNTSATINVATVPAAGYILIIRFSTDGTASNAITFGTNFKDTGTYNLNSANHWYTATFVSDGTYLVEVCRSGSAA